MITHITAKEMALITALQRMTEALKITTAERDALKADAERYDYLLTKRLGWISNRAPLPWGKQTQKEAMSLAIDAAMKGTS